MIIRALKRAGPSMRDIDPKGRLKCAMRGLCGLPNVLPTHRKSAGGTIDRGQCKTTQSWAVSLGRVPIPELEQLVIQGKPFMGSTDGPQAKVSVSLRMLGSQKQGHQRDTVKV